MRDATAFLAEWHRIVAEKDVASLAGVLAPDVTLGAPPYWRKLEGAALVAHLLGVIVQTIEGFTYHREWVRDREIALEFRGRVGGRELHGIDLISLDDDGRIRSLDVLMRPVNAIVALREAVAPRMAEYLARAADPATG
jgi:hypothetical protein